MNETKRKYFWDVDFESLDFKKNRFFIIERILEWGDERAIKWLKKNFFKKDIIKTLKNSKRLSDRSQNYWKFIFNIWNPKKLSLSSAKKQKRAWDH